jgi:hypothetical protein
MASTTCPVFRPTAEEFANFSKYIDKIDEEIGDYGICKVRTRPARSRRLKHTHIHAQSHLSTHIPPALCRPCAQWPLWL